MTKRVAPARNASTITGQNAKVVEDALVEYPEPPARLDANQADHFNELVRERPASFWRPMDLVMLAQFCVMWSKYLEVAAKVEDAEPMLGDKPNPLFQVHDRLFRQVDSMMRRLCLAPAQRVVEANGSSARDPVAQRAELARQAKVKDAMSGDDLLAKPMH